MFRFWKCRKRSVQFGKYIERLLIDTPDDWKVDFDTLKLTQSVLNIKITPRRLRILDTILIRYNHEHANDIWVPLFRRLRIRREVRALMASRFTGDLAGGIATEG